MMYRGWQNHLLAWPLPLHPSIARGGQGAARGQDNPRRQEEVVVKTVSTGPGRGRFRKRSLPSGEIGDGLQAATAGVNIDDNAALGDYATDIALVVTEHADDVRSVGRRQGEPGIVPL